MEKFDLYNYDRTLSGKTIERGNPVPDGYYRRVIRKTGQICGTFPVRGM